MEANACILVVDDEDSVREMLEDYLSAHGFSVIAAPDGNAMREAVNNTNVDLVLLDLNLAGGEDGLSLARELKSGHDIGIIMITAAGDIIDRVVGLEMGADDYLPKPFDPRELLARIKSVLRRVQRDPVTQPPSKNSKTLHIGKCILDLEAHQLLDENNREIPLTSMEFDLLKIFVERPNRVLTRDQILNLTQNRDWDPFDRSVDIRITRLRKKIERDPSKPEIIKTIRGAGYKFVFN